MLLGWVIVAALEWAAWRDQPHYGSGLPPRYYVPSLNLPPAQPLEQVAAGYPEAQRDEAPTWIASAALRAEMLGEWPVRRPPSARSRRRRPTRPLDAAAELPVAPHRRASPEPEPAAGARARPGTPESPSSRRPTTDPEPSACRRGCPRRRGASRRAARGGPLARYSLDPLAEARRNAASAAARSPSAARARGARTAEPAFASFRPGCRGRVTDDAAIRAMRPGLAVRELALAALALLAAVAALAITEQTRHQRRRPPQPAGLVHGARRLERAGRVRPAHGVRRRAPRRHEGVAHPTLPCGARIFITYERRRPC